MNLPATHLHSPANVRHESEEIPPGTNGDEQQDYGQHCCSPYNPLSMTRNIHLYDSLYMPFDTTLISLSK